MATFATSGLGTSENTETVFILKILKICTLGAQYENVTDDNGSRLLLEIFGHFGIPLQKIAGFGQIIRTTSMFTPQSVEFCYRTTLRAGEGF